MNKPILGAAVALVVAGTAFYGGTMYAHSQTPARGQYGMMGQFGASGQTRGMRGQGGGFTAGQIIVSGNGSITVQMPNGSTQIVLMGTSTQILKSVAGSMSDLQNGTSVVVNGSQNSDGSLTAQSIQIRPAGSTGFRPQGQ